MLSQKPHLLPEAFVQSDPAPAQIVISRGTSTFYKKPSLKYIHVMATFKSSISYKHNLQNGSLSSDSLPYSLQSFWTAAVDCEGAMRTSRIIAYG